MNGCLLPRVLRGLLRSVQWSKGTHFLQTSSPCGIWAEGQPGLHRETPRLKTKRRGPGWEAAGFRPPGQRDREGSGWGPPPAAAPRAPCGAAGRAAACEPRGGAIGSASPGSGVRVGRRPLGTTLARPRPGPSWSPLPALALFSQRCGRSLPRARPRRCGAPSASIG